MKVIASAIQIAGLAVLACAGWLVSEALGAALLGVGLIVYGVAMERG